MNVMSNELDRVIGTDRNVHFSGHHTHSLGFLILGGRRSKERYPMKHRYLIVLITYGL
jgi:hypothetical protein